MKRLLLCLGLLLGGCQQLATGPVPDQPRALENWNLSGRLGYRAADDGGSATLGWEQRADRGLMRLSGPLGFGSARITWGPRGAELETGRERVRAPGPAELAWRLTGVWLPVAALEYWVRGLPCPCAEGRPEFGPAGELRSLNQLGWQLDFDRYQSVADLRLPFRIRATHQDQRFTLIVREWEPLP